MAHASTDENLNGLATPYLERLPASMGHLFRGQSVDSGLPNFMPTSEGEGSQAAGNLTWTPGKAVEDTHVSPPSEAVAFVTEEKMLRSVEDWNLRHDDDCPAEFVCPLSLDIMVDPVIIASGQTFERAYIEEWLKKHSKCPKTNQELAHHRVVPDVAAKRVIGEWCEANGIHLPDKASVAKEVEQAVKSAGGTGRVFEGSGPGRRVQFRGQRIENFRSMMGKRGVRAPKSTGAELFAAAISQRDGGSSSTAGPPGSWTGPSVQPRPSYGSVNGAVSPLLSPTKDGGSVLIFPTPKVGETYGLTRAESLPGAMSVAHKKGVLNTFVPLPTNPVHAGNSHGSSAAYVASLVSAGQLGESSVENQSYETPNAEVRSGSPLRLGLPPTSPRSLRSLPERPVSPGLQQLRQLSPSRPRISEPPQAESAYYFHRSAPERGGRQVAEGGQVAPSGRPPPVSPRGIAKQVSPHSVLESGAGPEAEGRRTSPFSRRAVETSQQEPDLSPRLVFPHPDSTSPTLFKRATGSSPRSDGHVSPHLPELNLPTLDARRVPLFKRQVALSPRRRSTDVPPLDVPGSVSPLRRPVIASPDDDHSGHSGHFRDSMKRGKAFPGPRSDQLRRQASADSSELSPSLSSNTFLLAFGAFDKGLGGGTSEGPAELQTQLSRQLSTPQSLSPLSSPISQSPSEAPSKEEITRLLEVADLTEAGEALEAAVASLRQISKASSESRCLLGSLGATPVLLRVVQKTQTMTKESALTILMNLTLEATLKEQVVEHGGVEVLLQLVSWPQVEGSILEVAVGIICNLGVVEANRGVIRRSGLISWLVQLLGPREGSDSNSSRLRKETAVALFNLALNDACREEIISSWCVEVVLDVLREANIQPRLEENCSLLLCTLNKSPVAQQKMVKNGGVALMGKLVKLGNQAVQGHCAATLVLIASGSAEGLAAVEANVAISGLVHLSNHGNKRGAAKATALLRLLNYV
eukprot:TRINITY_DN11591_c0_g1_i1.p1 TRINITY_DN11591_c0_g1~~TRINITY_DN11591_c0_g1_i1.p1  ORF type:complete len:976 (+),score=101.35 TRINITY_DN11591_c0_g1_i1:162-3089(+)